MIATPGPVMILVASAGLKGGYRQSLLTIIGTNLASVLNYFYHFVIGRLLGPANYGELATLISVLVLLSIIPSSSGLVIIKFIATSKDAKEIGCLIKFFRSIILFTGFGCQLLNIVLC